MQHDWTVLCQLLGYGVYDNSIVTYASALFVELYEMSPGQFAVHLAYRNGTNDNTTTTLVIPGVYNTNINTTSVIHFFVNVVCMFHIQYTLKKDSLEVIHNSVIQFMNTRSIQ